MFKYSTVYYGDDVLPARGSCAEKYFPIWTELHLSGAIGIIVNEVSIEVLKY